jgi:hypothetical protein
LSIQCFATAYAFLAGVTALPTETCPGLVTAAFHPKNTSCVQDLRCSASPNIFPDLQNHTFQQQHRSQASKALSEADQQQAREPHCANSGGCWLFLNKNACHTSTYYW